MKKIGKSIMGIPLNRKGKILLLLAMLLAVLTVIYVVAVVNATVNSNSTNSEPEPSHVTYGCWAIQYQRSQPDQWYTPEELGIVGATEYENGTMLHIGVEPKERIDELMREQPIFLYNGKFYQVLPDWPEPPIENKGILISTPWAPIGGALAVSWSVFGLMFVKGRKK